MITRNSRGESGGRQPLPGEGRGHFHAKGVLIKYFNKVFKAMFIVVCRVHVYQKNFFLSPYNM